MPHPVWLGGTNVCKKNYPCQFSLQCATNAAPYAVAAGCGAMGCGPVCRVLRGAVLRRAGRCVGRGVPP